MENFKFKLGDKDKFINRENDLPPYFGEVVASYRKSDYNFYSVETRILEKKDSPVYISAEESDLEKVGDFNNNNNNKATPNQKIIIERKNREVSAKFYKNNNLVASSTAICHKEEDFDFALGAEMAFDLLTSKEDFLLNAKEEEKTLNMKFLCCSAWVVGLTRNKIYEIKDGKFKNDKGVEFPTDKKLYSREDLENYFGGLWGDGRIKSGSSIYSNSPVKYIEIVE